MDKQPFYLLTTNLPCIMHLYHTSCICTMHLHHAFAPCICTMHSLSKLNFSYIFWLSPLCMSQEKWKKNMSNIIGITIYSWILCLDDSLHHIFIHHSIHKNHFFNNLTIFRKHEMTLFWWFWQYLLFLCSDFHQIFISICIGGNLWIKLYFFHVI